MKAANKATLAAAERKRFAANFRKAQCKLAYPGTADAVGCCEALAPTRKALAHFTALFAPVPYSMFSYWWNDHGFIYNETTQQERFIALELAACMAETGDLT